MLPKIRRHAAMRFRALSSELREEMVQETIVRALFDYLRLVERGKGHVAFATPLARFAVAHVRQGRRIGGRLNSKDISSEYCRNRNGLELESLDSQDDAEGSWREVLVEDRRSTPANVAAMRIDVEQWLKTLPNRSRQLMERLVMGESTSDTARLFGISPGRVSQLRRELCRAWYAFHGEDVPIGL
jgi:RNA polymerase sigma factor (sigma-70 family)